MSTRSLRKEVASLTAENRQHPDPRREARLVQLRRELCVQTLGRRGRRLRHRAWPPAVEDRFPGVVGVPEITADAMTPDLVRSGILTHGCLLVRGLLTPERAEELAGGIDRAFQAYDASVSGSSVAETEPWFVPFDAGPDEHMPREWIRDGGGVLGVDSPSVLFDVIEAFEAAQIGTLVTQYLGERPVLLGKKLTLRRISLAEQHGVRSDPDWHQDGAFMGRDIHSINVWVSLSHCGVDAPGLDIVTRRFDDIVATGTDGANFDWSVGHGLVERVAPESVVRPVFRPGDALLFDHMMLHRTAAQAGMKNVRYAIEAWFAAPSGYPSDQVPIAY